MAGYINPSTEVRILSVPWDQDMTNTMWWSYYSEQENFMLSRTGKEFPLNTYQRIEPGVFRAAIDADDLYGYNYIMFRNRQFPSSKYGEKWFYAFITQVDYVNDGMSNIHFKIDPIQTWFFEAFGDDGESNIPTCWVKRIHQSKDEAGDNIQPEPVQLTDYEHTSFSPVIYQVRTNSGQVVKYTLSNGPHYSDDDENEDNQIYGYVAIVMVCDTSKQVEGHVYNGIYSGATLYGFSLDDDGREQLESLLESYTNKPEAIISIYLCPTAIVALHIKRSGDQSLQETNWGEPITCVFENERALFSDTAMFNTYTPKNKKCYTYPYQYFGIVSPEGGTLTLRYEYFYNKEPEAKLFFTFLDPVSCTIRPYAYGRKYKTNNENDGPNYEMELTINNFPQCSWNCDAFSSWVARNGVPILLNTISDIAIPKNSENPISESQIAAGDILSIASQTYTAAIAADYYKGNLNPGNVDCIDHTLEFYYARFFQPDTYIRYIDNYFTRYGYAQNKLMQPNMQARKYWTYVRTSDMDINAEIPADAKKEIDDVFNSGFTAWNYDYISTNISNYGDYSLDNTTLG